MDNKKSKIEINSERVKCPYCSELIAKTAKKCRFCGGWLNKENQETITVPKTEDQSSTDKTAPAQDGIAYEKQGDENLTAKESKDEATVDHTLKQKKEKKKLTFGERLLQITILGVFLFLAIVTVVGDIDNNDSVNSYDSQFSSWDGSHIELVRYIKSRMHNPRSFKHVKTIHREESGNLTVIMDYRGENALGATVLNTVIAKVDIRTGKVLSATF